MYRVMIVEDERIIRQGIVGILERFGEGMQVYLECSDGQEAWEKFCTDPPDIVITDVVMRGMSGLDLAERIRQVNDQIPIVILSGYSDFSYAQKAIHHNVSEYLLKPVNIKQFVAVLSRLKAQLDEQNGERSDDSTLEDPLMRSQIIRRAQEYIQNHLGDDLSLSVVAEQVNISNNYLSSLFKLEMNQTYSAYITQKRMEKARYLLDNSDFKIYEIAEICGYNSVNHFIGVFKKLVGVTPAQYKKDRGLSHAAGKENSGRALK